MIDISNITKLSSIAKLSVPQFEIPSVFKVDSSLFLPKYAKRADKVFIVGNGFDIGLGLNTSYKDFANSDFWPFDNEEKYPKGTLAFMLNEHKQLNTWFDLEELLFQYAKKDKSGVTFLNGISDIVGFDKTCVTLLIDNLSKYLQQEQNKEIDIEKAKVSILALMYFLFEDSEKTARIYSFNYTDIKLLASKANIDIELDYVQVHGSLKEDSCILGVGDKRELKDPYFYLHKSAHPTYKSNQLISDLCNAKDIIFYGHSLGDNDHDYFKDFFLESAKYVNRLEGEERTITFFTYDENSKMEIKKQLMKLTDNGLISLYAHCIVDIICVSNPYDIERFTGKIRGLFNQESK